MLSTFSLSVVILTWPGLANAEYAYVDGVCPYVTRQKTLDVAKYMGVWYEYQRFPIKSEEGQDCNSATYGQDEDRISVTNTGAYRIGRFPNKNVAEVDTVSGFATVLDPQRPAQLIVNFHGDGKGSNSVKYVIVDTDYTNYTVIFSCRQLQFYHQQFAWILTREPGVAPSNLGALENNLAALGFDVTQFKIVDQSGCPGRY